jgi:O-antigen/teichoic acid export membrane protein
MAAEREEQSLDTKILRGSSWAALSFGGGQVLSFLSTLVLARLLAPQDFGLVALALTFLLFLQYVQESGLGAALIFRRGSIEVAAGSALAFAPLIGLVLFGASVGLAPVAALVFGEPDLTALLQVLSLVLIVRSLAIVPGAILEREMRFRSIASGEIALAVTSPAVAIPLALSGAGAWSLVLGQLAAQAAQTLVLWLLVPWRPDPRRADRAVLRELLRYGRYVGAANVVNLANRTLDGLIVARMLGATSLGFYNIALRLAVFPSQVIGNIATRALFAAFSSIQHDLPAFRRTWVDGMQRIALLSTPVSVGIIVAAEPIVGGLLGEKWLPAVGPLRILAVLGLVKAFAATTGEALLALDRGKLRLVLAIVHVLLIVPLVVGFTSLWGLNGAAAAMLIADVATGVPAIVVVMRLLALRPAELALALAPSTACAAILGLALAALLPIADALSPGLELLALVLAGLGVYAAATALLARQVVVTMWVGLRGARPTGS